MATGAAIVAGLVTPATAATDRPTLASVLDLAMAGGTLTADQRAVLMTRPDLAGRIVDPAATQAGSRQSASGGEVGIAAVCGWYEAWVTEYSYLGDDLYRFKQHEAYCRDGRNVTLVDNRYAIGTTLSTGIRYHGVIGNSSSRTPTSTHTGFMQGHFEGCLFKQGCWDDGYPWVKIYLRGNGAHTYSGYSG